uniref:Uncharacterized protein n=1 Tax=Panagrolaimus davidi TaxID=227884 RepID=A0A914QDF2_9BILA
MINPNNYNPVFNYSLDLSITAFDDFFTVLTFENVVTYSINNTLYYQDKPIRYYTFNDIGLEKKNYTYCPSITGPCNITQFNADSGSFQIPVYLDGYNNLYNDYSSDTYIFNQFIFDGATLYNFNSFDEYFFDPLRMPCFTETVKDPFDNEIIFQQYCCTNYNYITAPEIPPSQCVQFQSNTTFTSSNGTLLSLISAQYALTSIGIEYSVNPNILPSLYTYNFYSNRRGRERWGYMSSWTMFDRQYDSNSNFEFNMVSYIGNDYTYDDTLIYYGITISGRIVRRNGIFYKDEMNPYTPENPCWNSIAPIYSGSKATNNFCCTKFQPFDSGTSCEEYQSITKVYTKDYNYYKGIYFNVKYQFNETSLILSILSFGNLKNSTLQIESYSTDTFSQTCQASTTSPQNTCVFRLSTTNQYELQYRTSLNTNPISMTTIFVSGNQISDPNLSPSKPCQASFSDAIHYYQKDTATTELCCISQTNGPWPGALSSFGYS